jgi:hypothetical protein
MIRAIIRWLARREIDAAFREGVAWKRNAVLGDSWWFSADTPTMQMIASLAKGEDTWTVRDRWEKGTGRQASPRPLVPQKETA